MSDSATGLPYRWAIKFFLPFGFFVILLSAVAVCLRKAVQLFGPDHLARTIDDIEADEVGPSEAEFIKTVVSDTDPKVRP